MWVVAGTTGVGAGEGGGGCLSACGTRFRSWYWIILYYIGFIYVGVGDADAAVVLSVHGTDCPVDALYILYVFMYMNDQLL